MHLPARQASIINRGWWCFEVISSSQEVIFWYEQFMQAYILFIMTMSFYM